MIDEEKLNAIFETSGNPTQVRFRILDLCYTAWQKGKNNPDGNWADDTLPTIQNGVGILQKDIIKAD